MAKIFVTGAAGFIGSNVVDHCLTLNHSVVGYDNLSTGQMEFLEQGLGSAQFKFVKGDVLDETALAQAMKGCDYVFHFAANADVRFGLLHPFRDLEQNTIATFKVLEAMRKNEIKNIVFSSTGSIYGDTKQIPTPEAVALPQQTSLYGASKLAGESLLQAYCEGFGFTATIFRFVSILGSRYTHGHVFDFFKKLKDNPRELNILGNGKQKKSYLDIEDCVRAISHIALNRTDIGKCEIYNLGTSEYCQVTDSIGWICDELGLSPKLIFEGSDRGWVGDNPFIFLDTSKVLSTGWKPVYSIEQGVRRTMKWLEKNQWVFQKR